MTDRKKDTIVGIAGVTGGISLCIVLVVAIFAKEQLAVTPWIVLVLAAMGVGLGYFASRK